LNGKLFNRDFSLVAAGQVISIFGAVVVRFALDLYVLDITGRADIFALVLALSAIPGILFSPIGGAIADRFNRRNLMVIFDFSSSAIIAALLLMINTGHSSVVVIGFALAMLSLISSMYQPTVQASVPALVSDENLASANGFVSGVGAISGLLGPVAGGVLYSQIGLNTLIGLSCAAFLFSAVMEIFIHMPFAQRERTHSMFITIIGDLKSGFFYIVKVNPTILKIVLLATAFNLFMLSFFIVGIPYILRIIMRSSGAMYGIGMGTGQLAAIIGAVLVGVFSRKMQLETLHRVLFFVAILLIPLSAALTPLMLGLGYWPSFILFITSCTAVMLLMTVISIFIITSVQKKTPDDMLGKVMAIIMAGTQCAAPLGQALYGFMLEIFKSAVYIPALAAFLFTMVIVFAARAALRSGAAGRRT
jgi:MFS family permease